MKLQLQEQALRLRLSEADLGNLLAGGGVELAVRPGPGAGIHLRVVLGPDLALDATGGLASEGPGGRDGIMWSLHLPEAAMRAYAATLPRRDALELALGGPEGAAVRLDIEVDIRDSVKVRRRTDGTY